MNYFCGPLHSTACTNPLHFHEAEHSRKERKQFHCVPQVLFDSNTEKSYKILQRLFPEHAACGVAQSP